MNRIGAILLRTCSWGALLVAIAPSAWAQETKPDVPQGAAPAQDSAKVEDIVVTAQFRRQNLQQTPIAITDRKPPNKASATGAAQFQRPRSMMALRAGASVR